MIHDTLQTKPLRIVSQEKQEDKTSFLISICEIKDENGSNNTRRSSGLEPRVVRTGWKKKKGCIRIPYFITEGQHPKIRATKRYDKQLTISVSSKHQQHISYTALGTELRVASLLFNKGCQLSEMLDSNKLEVRLWKDNI